MLLAWLTIKIKIARSMNLEFEIQYIRCSIADTATHTALGSNKTRQRRKNSLQSCYSINDQLQVIMKKVGSQWGERLTLHKNVGD